MRFFFGNFLKLGNTQSRDALNQLLRDGAQIRGEARTLYSESERLNRLTSEETLAVSRAASALTEIHAMLEKTSSHATGLAERSASARNSVDVGISALQRLDKSLEEIATYSSRAGTSTQANTEKLRTILKTMQEIQGRSQVIRDIAFQTKLLAFNASVEAARAGEHGKGFAVVAQEMAQLAQTSAGSAEAIERILSESLAQTEEAVKTISQDLLELTGRTQEKVAESQQRSQSCSESYGRIVNEVEQVKTMSQEIAQSATEQEMGVKEIASSISKLEENSRELANITQKNHKTALSLSEKSQKQADTLAQLANQFGIEIAATESQFDFDAAMSAHIDWKMKLDRFLAKPDGSLDPAVVCQDNRCALGKWLHGDGQAYSRIGQFSELKSAHAEFHKTAGSIIELALSGRMEEAKKLLSPGGYYSGVSQRCVQLIGQMKESAGTSQIQSGLKRVA